MTGSQATAEVFITALKSLSKKERNHVILRIAEEKELREDLLDLSLIAQRKNESSRPFLQFTKKFNR